MKIRFLMVACITFAASFFSYSSAHAEGTSSATYKLPIFSQVFAPTSRLLFNPLANPEGQCGNDIPNQPGFADVGKHDEYCFSLRELVQLGAIVGYPCGGLGEPCDSQNSPYFRPNSHVT